jgi:heparanase 1
MWVTETADAACGGNPWASTFLDTFRYVDQLGRLARRGVNVVYHNTLASSEYGLLDQDTFEPRPDYWGALLWRRLMGTTVLDTGEGSSSVHEYAHCLRDTPGGVAVLAVNTSRDVHPLDLPIAAERYTLTAPRLDGSDVLLNGQPLALQAGDALPPLSGEEVAPGRIELAPSSITFLRIAGASNPSCRS